MRLGYLFVFLAIFCCSASYSQIKNEEELKKQAQKYFEEEEYNLAYKDYAQLVSLYPKDPEFNYRLGVCMLFTEPDKKKPYSYLQLAVNSPKDAPKEAKFYLAKTYHMNYKFDDAIKLYNEYKQTASSSNIKKLQVDREIDACRNGKRLLSNLSDLVVINKKQLNEADYFRSYDIKDIGGKLLVKPEDFKTGTDKKKKEKSVIYLPRTGDKVYYSSYGENGDKGRDIYFVNKLPNGTWGKPIAMPAPINTEYDEDYPFLHPNGKTLYFSSKGHNSMGGYDVFKTTFDDQTNTWSKPVNLDFPINSPDDDILFVTDSLEKTAYFSTGRYSPYGKIDVLKVNTERRPMNFAVLKGAVVKEDVTQSVKSKITIKNMENGEIVGTYQADDNGDYNMELPNGGKLLFTVETPGLPTQSDGVQMPIAYSLKPYKQIISYDNDVLKIINYFDGQINDDNYSMMIDLIEKKAKLEINESEPYNNNLKDGAIKNNNNNASGNLNSVSTNNPTANGNNENNSTGNNTNKNVTNEQLLSIAKTDAKEASDESIQLKKDAQDAFGLATQKTEEANEKQKEADNALTNANSITDVNKKNEELAKANSLKEEANVATNVANMATNLAKKLEVDANQKQKEADLTNEYIKELELVTKNKNNKEALAKLEEIQKQLDDISKQKNQSDELFTSIKAELDLKQNEIQKTEKKNNDIQNEINNIKSEEKTLETDLANETDKSLKENISAQIRELNNDIEIKNKELAVNNQKSEAIKKEVEGLNKELEIAAKILKENTDNIATNSTNISNNNNNNNGNSTNGNTISNNNTNNGNNTENKNVVIPLSYNNLTEKYSEQIKSTAIDNSTKEGLTKQNTILTNYNKEATDLIAIDKTELSKTKDANEKKKLNQEIKDLEKLKTDNTKLITANSSKIKTLESTTIANNTNNNGNNANNNSTTIENNNGNTTSVESNTTAIANNTNSENNNGNGTPITNSNNNNAGNNNSTETNTTSISVNNNSTDNNGNAITNNNANGNNNSTENNSTVINNDANNNGNNTSNGNAITNNEPGNKEVLKPIDLNKGGDNSTYLNDLNSLQINLNSNTKDAGNLFAYTPYLEKSSVTLKEQADQKFELAKQKEKELAELIKNAEANLKAGVGNSNTAKLQSEADALSNKAFQQRKEAATKTGTEKDALIKEAVQTEKLALTKKLEVATTQKDINNNKFDNNTLNLKELQKLSANKNTSEVTEANTLITEAEISFKQASKIREETNAYGSDGAKLGGFSNAEEKENEALLKQQKALDLLTKVNPTYKLITPKDAGNTNTLLASLNDEIAKTTQTEIDAYSALSKANQNELKLQGDKLVKNPTFKNPSNKNAQDLKITSDKLNKEAQTFITQSITAKTTSEKSSLLLKANDKEIEALKALRQAEGILNGTIATNNNNTENNTGITNNNTENNNAANSNTITTNNNTDNNNGVAINNSENNNTAKTTTLSTNNSTDNNNSNGNNVALNNNGENTNNSNNNITENNNIANNNTGNNTENNTAINNIGANTSTTGNGIVDEASKLKNSLNNTSETNLAGFNSYTNSEAISLKENAITKINAALNEDKTISTQLDNVNQLANNTSTQTPLSQENITSLISEADKLSSQAFALRKNAATKTGAEKEKDINEAKALEKQAITKKVEAANKQQQLNTATFDANKQSLEDLAKMAQGKNIAELKDADLQMNDANVHFKQASNLRTEANALPTDGAKLGGYSNAEEKENLAIAKQKALIDVYKKYFSNYVVKQPVLASENNEAVAKLNETKNNYNTNNQQHIDGLTTLTQANEKEYKSRYIALPQNLDEKQTVLKTKAQEAYKKQQSLVTQANQTNDPTQKKNLLIEASQNGQLAINALEQITNANAVALNIKEGNAGNKTNNTGNDNAVTNNNNTGNNTTGNNTNSNTENNTNNNNVVTNNNSGNNTANNNTANTNANANNSNTNTAENNNTNAGNNAVTNNNTNNAGNNNTSNNANTNTVKLKVEGLDIKTNNAYSAANPIPIDEKIPDGLVFKVQIGAFKAPLPNNTFKGLSPVIAQTTPNGYIRYMAGNFDKFESANAVKNDLRNLGYSDAFVVGYYDGKRITLAEALEKLKAAGKQVDLASSNNTTAGLTTNANVPRNTTLPTTNNTTNVTTDNTPVEVTKELETTNGLLYTIQIGVFSKQATRSQLYNLRPIYTEKLPNGLFRYTTGIYNQTSKALEAKQKIILVGVKDAFITAYYNTKRVAFTEAQRLQTENNNLKMETENPVIFPGNSASTSVNNSTNNNTPTNTTQPTIAPFNNGVTKGPTPTAENGVKNDDTGISYKVQIGAYKNQVPNDVAAKFSSIKTWPVQNVVINGLYIYTIGNFTGMSFAKKLKEEAVSVGITDAYITVYKDGKKLYGAEANEYLSK